MLAVLLALALDAGLGWPAILYRGLGHPVGLFARIIARCARGLNRPGWARSARRGAGVFTVALLILVAGGGAWLAQYGLMLALGRWGWLGVGALAWPALAQRSLDDHVCAVARPLARGDLAGARAAVGMIVGRDTGALDSDGVARAAVESLAESFCDGVAAPLFWFVLLGLPGVWAYKALNTADSLIGHPEEPWRDFGWAAARADDLANLLPARVAGVVLCLAGGGGARILWRDHGRHASPNAGWPEAAMAGALGGRLAGPISYDGVMRAKAWIGDGPALGVAALPRALVIYRRGCALLWVMAMGVAWLR